MLENKIFISLLPLIIANGILVLSLVAFAFVYPHRKRTKEVTDKMHPSFIGVYLMEYWYWFTTPFMRLFMALGLTPNMLTGFSLIIALFSGYFYFEGNFALAGWILGFNGLFDTLDGRLARITNQVTKEGAFFDSCSDRYAEGIILMGIALYFRNNLLLLAAAILALVGSEIVSYAKARGESVGVSTKRGLMQRTERGFIIGLVSVFYPFLEIVLLRYHINPEVVWLVTLILMAVLTNYTAAVRIVVIFNDLRRLKNQNE